MSTPGDIDLDSRIVAFRRTTREQRHLARLEVARRFAHDHETALTMLRMLGLVDAAGRPT